MKYQKKYYKDALVPAVQCPIFSPENRAFLLQQQQKISLYIECTGAIIFTERGQYMEKDVADEISSVLSDTGEFDVEKVNSGEEAIKKITANDYDVVLLDIRMPKVSGIEVLRELFRLEKPTEAIMVTALDDAKSAWDAAKAGAYDYITKPFRNEELILRIKMALQRRERNVQLNRELDAAAEFLRLMRENPEEHKRIVEEWLSYRDKVKIDHISMTPRELAIVFNLRKENPKWYQKKWDVLPGSRP
jgi:DNA-binding response OmpR family regulator